VSQIRPLGRLLFAFQADRPLFSSLAQVSGDKDWAILRDVRPQASLMAMAVRTGYFPNLYPTPSTGLCVHQLLVSLSWSRIPSPAPLLPAYTAAYGSCRDPLTVPEYCSLQYPRRFGSAKIKHTPSSHNRPLALDCVGYRGGR
jgi:hypothetical protein